MEDVSDMRCLQCAGFTALLSDQMLRHSCRNGSFQTSGSLRKCRLTILELALFGLDVNETLLLMCTASILNTDNRAWVQQSILHGVLAAIKRCCVQTSGDVHSRAFFVGRNPRGPHVIYNINSVRDTDPERSS